MSKNPSQEPSNHIESKHNQLNQNQNIEITKNADSQQNIQQKNLIPNEESNVQLTQLSKEEIYDSVTSKELQNQFSSINNNSPLFSSNDRNKKAHQGSNNGDEPNDIDDDLIFSQNTIETREQNNGTEREQLDTPSIQQQSKNEEEKSNNLEDSLERQDNFMFNTTPLKDNNKENKKPNKYDQKMIIIENQKGNENIENKKTEDQIRQEKLINDPNMVQNLIGSVNYEVKNLYKDLDTQKVALGLQTGESEKDHSKQATSQENSPQKNEQEQELNQKQVTFQATNFTEEDKEENVKFGQNQFNQQNKQPPPNLQIVQEESNVFQSMKGSIIPPQTNIELNINDQLVEESNEKKHFDYQQLEGFLKNQKRNLIYPNTTQNEQIEIPQEYDQNTQPIEQDCQEGEQSPLINKGNSSRAAGLSINSDKVKFVVQPIVNSSQFFNQNQKSNKSPSHNETDNGQGNRNTNSRGVRQGQEQQSKYNTESLEVSEVYQSNFYQDGGQSGKNLSDQTFVSISNSSQPSHFVNKLSNNKYNQFNSQDEFSNDIQLQQSKSNLKRFTNLRESVNDEQDIPEELSTYSKNTVQRYMVEQVNIMGSGSMNNGKRQSTTSMLTVESKDMEAATQDQVKKIVAEQVENMIKSKLKGQSVTKQNNMIFNNEDLFRQVIREELQNFLKNNTNLAYPASIPHIQSPTGSNQNSRLQDRRNVNKIQIDKHQAEKKQSTASVSQKDQAEMNSQKDIQSRQSHYLNNEDLEEIIDESIQKHQQVQLQNRQIQQNQQTSTDIQQQNAKLMQNKNDQSTIQKQYHPFNYQADKRLFEETKKKEAINKSGDYAISITNNNPVQYNNQRQFSGLDENNSQEQQNFVNKSYKEQYRVFKNALQNEESRDNSLQNYAQNYQVHERQQSMRSNQHQTSYISSENSPQFARDRDSLRLNEISFNANKQQINQLNRQFLLNDSHSSNLNSQFYPQQTQSKNGLFQQQQNRNIQSKQSDYSIQSFAPPLPPSRQGRQYQDSHNNSSQNQQDTQREIITEANSPPIQSPTNQGRQGLKVNYQEYIVNPPKRNAYGNDYENENMNQQVYNNLMESSIIQRNSEQHQSLESIQHHVFQNQSGGLQINQNTAKTQQNRQQEIQNQQSITQLWEKALDFHQRGQLNRAYQMLLDIEDDIYLIRMMSITGPCFSKLNQNVGKKLLRRINKITQSQFMDNISLQLCQKAYEQDLLEDINLEDNQNLKEILYDISASPHLGEQAARLYNLIDHSQHN